MAMKQAAVTMSIVDGHDLSCTVPQPKTKAEGMLRNDYAENVQLRLTVAQVVLDAVDKVTEGTQKMLVDRDDDTQDGRVWRQGATGGNPAQPDQPPTPESVVKDTTLKSHHAVVVKLLSEAKAGLSPVFCAEDLYTLNELTEFSETILKITTAVELKEFQRVWSKRYTAFEQLQLGLVKVVLPRT